MDPPVQIDVFEEVGDGCWDGKGGDRARYYGLDKVKLQLFWSAAMVNIERLMVIGQTIASLGTMGAAIGVGRSPLQDLPASAW